MIFSGSTAQLAIDLLLLGSDSRHRAYSKRLNSTAQLILYLVGGGGEREGIGNRSTNTLHTNQTYFDTMPNACGS